MNFEPTTQQIAFFGLTLADRPRMVGDITAAKRKRLALSQFALPGRRYPIDTVRRARNALARVAQHGTPEERRKVRAAVKRKWPSIEVSED